MPGEKKFKFKPSTTAFSVFSMLFVSAVVYIFWGTWGVDSAFVQPDNGTVHSMSWVSKKWIGALTGGMLTPFEMCQSLGGPYVWQELQYAVASLCAALGVAFYLRGRGLDLVACYGGGLFYGFSGYSLSLFSAGHLGWFMWLSYGPFAFGLVDRVVRKGKFLNWILLGSVLAWGGARQPDMWLLFTVLTFFYGVWCLVREKGGTMTGKPASFWSGLAACAIVMLAIGWPQFNHAIFHDLGSRDKQIEATSGVSAGESAEAKEAARWQFVTGWSMPPEDVLEFAAPLCRGCSSDFRVSPDIPYWGRLGRAPDESFVAGRMMPNYRQHSLYLGAITCAFALIGIFAFLFRRKDAKAEGESPADFSDVAFWTVSAAVVLLCSFGRFTPFYKVVYALPFGDYLRAPVKFHHLFEMCAAVLGGYGICGVLSGLSGRRFKSGVYAALALGAILLLFGIASDANSLASSIAKLGYADTVAKKGAANFSVSCIRGAILVLAVAVVAAKAWKLPLAKRLLAVSVLVVAGTADLALTNRKFISVQSLKFQKARNDAADDIVKAGGKKVYIALLPQEGRQYIAESFSVRDVGDTGMHESPAFVFAAESSFRRDKHLLEMRKAGELETIGAYKVTENGIVSTRTSPNTFLFKIKNRPLCTEEENPLSAWSIVSLATTFAVLAICGFALLKARRKGR
jgi:hypothetical protein